MMSIDQFEVHVFVSMDWQKHKKFLTRNTFALFMSILRTYSILIPCREDILLQGGRAHGQNPIAERND